MLNKLFSRGRNVIFCWIVFLGFGIFLFNFSLYPALKSLSKNTNLPEETFGFSSGYFYSFLQQLDEAGYSTYSAFQILDLLNATLLGITIFATLYYLLNKLEAHRIFRFVLVFPVLAAVVDIAENLSILYLVSSLPDKLNSLAGVVSILTSSKLFVASLAFLSVIVCAFAWTVKFVINRFTSK